MENDNSDEVNRLAYLQAAYTQQYELISNEIATYVLTRDSLMRSAELAERIGSVENANILAGNGSIMFAASTASIKRMMVYVGAGYVVEKSIEETKAFIEKLTKANEEAIQKLSAEKNKIERTLAEISYDLNALQGGAQQ
ncbi:MAG: hypothetical protein ACP5T3_02885 [Candidatus Micrarchaeia archaeon]